MISTIVLLSIAGVLVRPAAAQTQCGGDSFTPGTVNLTLQCYNAFQSCVSQFQADPTLVYCQDPAGNIDMQQAVNTGASGSSQNSDVAIAYQDIVEFCIRAGQTSGTWGYSDNQWYWGYAGGGCYTNDPTRTDVVSTEPPRYCVQNRDSTLPECYPQPNPTTGGPLKVLKYSKTKNGFTSASRGYNTWGVQALQNPPAVVPSFGGPTWDTGLTQAFVETQCAVLAQPAFQKAGYVYCTVDSGWQSMTTVDNYGRITYNSSRFNIPQLSSWLHSKNLKLGLYVIPGVPCSAQNATVQGTNIKVGSLWNGNFDQIFCDWDFTKNGVQQWHNSVVAQWASWGVDFIKLDYLTPGSPQNGANLACNNLPAAQMYQQAIQNSGRPMQLHFSWKLCRNETWLPLWSALGESIRTDQDIDNYGFNTLLDWSVAQRAIENYRQYIGLQAQRNAPITIYPDLDNLLIPNAQSLSGVTDIQRITIMNHWLGAGANLILSGDLTQIDQLGLQLTTSSQSIAAANFFATFPMQPRNPGTGSNLAQQLQAWIAGPSPQNEAYVLIVNYGPDGGSGGFGTQLKGNQSVTVSLTDLGISGNKWVFTDVWKGNCTTVLNSYTAWLGVGGSQLLHLKR